MANVINTQITRRKFVIAAGGVVGLAVLPSSLTAAPGANHVAPGLSGSLGRHSVNCDFVSDDGILRPRAWRLANGTALEIAAADSNPHAVFTSPILTGETLRHSEFATGYAQEFIRPRFGEEVAYQVANELERLALSVIRS